MAFYKLKDDIDRHNNEFSRLETDLTFSASLNLSNSKMLDSTYG